jgi:hypothetical protein
MIQFFNKKTTISRAIFCSILVFNIWKEQKHAEIEREFQNSPYFLGAESADFGGIFCQNIGFPHGGPPEIQ